MTENIIIPEGKKIYFASDFHLGIPDYAESLKREKKLVRWLEQAAKDAFEIYLMGDIFDFWFEYKTTVPKGFVRLLGKIAELTDQGIRINIFRGNHDLWAFDYLEEVCGAILYREPVFKKYNNKIFFLTHGDGLGPGDRSYKILKRIFEFRPNQFLFRWIHPDIGTRLGLYFSHRSRLAHVTQNEMKVYNPPNEELPLWHYANEHFKKHPEVNYYIFGHYHLMREVQLSETTYFMLLGDWINSFSYAVFEGSDLVLTQFKD